jgi:hypothetical protein
MPNYSLLIETALTGLGAGVHSFKAPKLFDAADNRAAHREAHAEADHLTVIGTPWVRITLLSADGTEIAEVRRTASVAR